MSSTLTTFCFVLFSFALYGQNIEFSIDKAANSSSYGQIHLLGFSEKELQEIKEQNLSVDQWSTFFRITVKDFDRQVLGQFRVKENHLVFTPRFLPDPEVEYVVTFDAQNLKQFLPHFSGESLKDTIQFNKLSEHRDLVVTMIPNIDTVPANMLRFYLEFSEPMGFENPYDFISIEDADGQKLQEPFVEIPNGLWNPARNRLTILFHPGRVKRGVGPNLTHGNLFEKGKSYMLIISERWESTSGSKIPREIRKSFVAAAAVREKIDYNSWIVQPPSVGSKNNLSIELKENLDIPLARRMLSIKNEKGLDIAGNFEFDPSVKKLLFLPKLEWSDQKYIIAIEPALEDICGNTVLHGFDVNGSMLETKTSFDSNSITIDFRPIPNASSGSILKSE